MISVMRRCVICSKPLARLTTGTQGRIQRDTARSVSRKLCEGTPTTSTSQCSAASSMDAVARNEGFSGKSLRYALLRWSRLICSTISARRDQITVDAFADALEAMVVPQDPAPRTDICTGRLTRRPRYLDFASVGQLSNV